AIPGFINSETCVVLVLLLGYPMAGVFVARSYYEIALNVLSATLLIDAALLCLLRSIDMSLLVYFLAIGFCTVKRRCFGFRAGVVIALVVLSVATFPARVRHSILTTAKARVTQSQIRSGLSRAQAA